MVPLSKNKGKDQAEPKDIRPIIVRSHRAKILEKTIMAFSRIYATCDITTIGLMSLSSAWSFPFFLDNGTNLPSYRYLGMLIG